MVNSFTNAEIRKIADAIADAELETSGEIRVHIEPRLKGDALERAVLIFRRLKMDRTKERNGVLILIALKSRAFAILGDVGISEKAPPDFWNITRDLMQAYFREDRFLEGVIAGVHKAAESLRTHFPHRRDDTNELSNDVTISKE